MRSAAVGDTAQVVSLLQSDASAVFDHHQRDESGWTPLHYAVEFGHLDVAELLLRWCPPMLYQLDLQGFPPIVWAAYYNRTDMGLL